MTPMSRWRDPAAVNVAQLLDADTRLRWHRVEYRGRTSTVVLHRAPVAYWQTLAGEVCCRVVVGPARGRWSWFVTAGPEAALPAVIDHGRADTEAFARLDAIAAAVAAVKRLPTDQLATVDAAATLIEKHLTRGT